MYVETTVMAIDSPSQIYTDGIIQRLREVNRKATPERINNAIDVELFYTTMGKLVTSEFEKTPIFNLIGNVGGQLGMFQLNKLEKHGLHKTDGVP